MEIYSGAANQSNSVRKSFNPTLACFAVKMHDNI